LSALKILEVRLSNGELHLLVGGGLGDQEHKVEVGQIWVLPLSSYELAIE
jgi:hypothetical protein